MRRWLNRTWFLIPVLLFSWLSPVWAEGGFSFKAGLGYEFISQEFFLDSLTQTGVDSLTTITSLKTTYLDDIKGQLSLRYTSADHRRLDLTGTLEQTPDVFRFRTTSDYRPTWGKLKIDWNGELDWRQGVSDSADAGDSYILGYGKARFVLPISSGGSTSLWWQVRSEVIRFDSGGDYNLDYSRWGGKVGLSRSMTDFSTLSVNGFVSARFVADSSELDYRDYGLESSYLGFKAGSTLDLYARLEKKDYRQPDNEDDYLGLEVNVRHKFTVKERWFLRQDLDLEALYFDQPDFVNRDYRRLKLVLQGGLQAGDLALALGPHMELLGESPDQDEALASGEDYFEGGIRANIDYFRPNLFGLLESTMGHRNIYSSADLQSDFVFHRLNVVFDWRFWGTVGVNALVSAEWEWHEDRSENSQLYLVSTWLTCRF